MKKFHLLFIKIGNLINFMINSLIIKLIHLQKRSIKEKTLLIIRLDSIGDYILVQNFFNVLRNDSLFKNFNITLCGNIIWKDLAEHCNKKDFDNFIWINKNKFKWNLFYKYDTLRKIYLAGYEIAVETTFSREILFADTIIKASKAKERIGYGGSQENYVKWKRSLFSDDYYTKLITQSSEILFEFYRNKEFFEKMLKKKIEITKPYLDFISIKMYLPLPQEYIVIVPGAQEKSRRWSEEKFIELIKSLLNNFTFDVMLVGSASEYKITEKIAEQINSERVLNLAGKTNLPELGKIISNAKLLISNETSAVHFAAAVDTKFICLSNGQRFGRFMPYPKEMNLINEYFYPYYIEKNLTKFNKLAEELKEASKFDINEISIDKVLNAVKKLLESK